MIPAQGGRRPPAVLRGARRLHASRLPFFSKEILQVLFVHGCFSNLKGQDADFFVLQYC